MKSWFKSGLCPLEVMPGPGSCWVCLQQWAGEPVAPQNKITCSMAHGTLFPKLLLRPKVWLPQATGLLLISIVLTTLLQLNTDLSCFSCPFKFKLINLSFSCLNCKKLNRQIILLLSLFLLHKTATNELNNNWRAE